MEKPIIELDLRKYIPSSYYLMQIIAIMDYSETHEQESDEEEEDEFDEIDLDQLEKELDIIDKMTVNKTIESTFTPIKPAYGNFYI